METLASPQQSERWPLGWLYALTLGLAAGFAVLLGWLFLQSQEYYFTSFWFWLAPGLWLVLAVVGMLALKLGLENLLRRQTGRALAWLGLSVLALGSCAATAVPLFVLTLSAPSVGDPPPGDNER